MAPRAGTSSAPRRRRSATLAAAVLGAAVVVALLLAPEASPARPRVRQAAEFPLHAVRPWPLEFPNSQYLTLKWSEVKGWEADDDLLAAFNTFRVSCKPIAAERGVPATPKALGTSLREPCRAARSVNVRTAADARAFFERRFTPLQISRLGEADGFVTGYYEPVLEGSKTPTDVFNVPVYRRPSNLFIRGVKQDGPAPNTGQVFRKIGRRKLVPYYDRGEIEDGAIAGRGLEICYLKNQTDLLFMQIQGSGRVKLDDGSTLRVNYDAQNGQPYTPVGRVLIERNIIPKEEMSMQRIREWMEANPDGAKELRRQNKSYVFFREVKLADNEEAIGGQGVPLTPERSIAVDRSLHIYGTPFFLGGTLPLTSEKSPTPFHRLMIAQDTGSAITGPARADIYFGAGADAGHVAGRLRNSIRFTILVPKPLDPNVAGLRMGLPEARPSEKIAKLLPQTLPTKDARSAAQPAAAPVAPPSPQASVDNKSTATDRKTTGSQPAASAPATSQPAPAATVASAVPLPQARPELLRERSRVQHRRRHRS